MKGLTQTIGTYGRHKAPQYQPFHDTKLIEGCDFTTLFIIGPFSEELYGDTFQAVSVADERSKRAFKII